MNTQLNHFLLTFKVNGVVRTESICAPTFSMAKDKLHLHFPECYDINYVTSERAVAPYLQPQPMVA